MNAIPTAYLALEIKKDRGEQYGYINLKCTVPASTSAIKRSTGWKVPVKHWDDVEMRVRSTWPDADVINEDIRGKLSRLRDALTKMLTEKKAFTKDSIKRAIDGGDETQGNFVDFYKYHIDVLKSRGAEKSYIEQFNSQYRLFKKYAGDYVAFSEIDWQYLERYEIHCRQQSVKGEPASLNTVCKKMKRLTEVVARAVKMGKIQQKDVGAYKVPARPSVKADHLNMAQVQQLTNDLIYEKKYDYDPLMRMVATYFLVEIYSGIRHSDWSRFDITKNVDAEGLKVITKKTDAYVYLPFSIFKGLERVVNYIRENNIRFDLSLDKTNARLHTIGRDLRLPFKLTTHVGRHTCGTMLGELGYDTATIALVLGVSEGTARVYVKRTAQGLKNAFELIGKTY